MAPNGESNLAVQDAVTALTFLRGVLPSFGGDPSKVTVAGQSSGAKLIRALLAAPSADSLFRSAILHSDVMVGSPEFFFKLTLTSSSKNYGFLPTTVQQQFQNYFNSKINCASSDQSCFDGLSVPMIIQAQTDLFHDAAGINQAAGPEPIRPVLDSSFIATSLDATASPFPHVSKPLLITTVLNEAGPFIYGTFPSPLPESAWQPIVDGSLGPTRGPAVRGSPYYPVTPDLSNDIRPLLEKLGTDQQWKCSSWTFARDWVSNGGSAYVGVFNVGATYVTNSGIPFCSEAGHVCHEDDIEIVVRSLCNAPFCQELTCSRLQFGTVQDPNRTQKALIKEMQRRYKAFLHNGNPNPSTVNQPSLPRWEPATSSNVHPLNLGSSGEAPVGACDPSFWGQQVPYDYQL
jgi:carboxylesterase type B